MKDYFSDKPWALTEFAIENAKTNAVVKGQRYADFIHRVSTDTFSLTFPNTCKTYAE